MDNYMIVSKDQNLICLGLSAIFKFEELPSKTKFNSCHFCAFSYPDSDNLTSRRCFFTPCSCTERKDKKRGYFVRCYNVDFQQVKHLFSQLG